MKNGEFNSADLKKGMVVLMVTVWNHHFNQQRTLGRNETVIPADSYKLQEVTVHSAGKQQIYLMDENGMKGERFSVKNPDYNYSYFFALTHEDALKVAEDLHNTDKNATETYTIV